MTDFIAQPTTIREIPGVAVIQQVGDQANVNGRSAYMILAPEIVSNAKHDLRAPLASVMHRLQSGDVAAVVVAEINGKPAQILITAEQFAVGASERARL